MTMLQLRRWVLVRTLLVSLEKHIRCRLGTISPSNWACLECRPSVDEPIPHLSSLTVLVTCVVTVLSTHGRPPRKPDIEVIEILVLRVMLVTAISPPFCMAIISFDPVGDMKMIFSS